MVVMNGLETICEYTYESKYQGASVIDYIALDNRLVTMKSGQNTDEEECPEYKYKLTHQTSQDTSFQENKEEMSYIPKTMKVWKEYADVISDHRLITCHLGRPTQEVRMSQGEDQIAPLKKDQAQPPKWKRRDNGNRSYWDKMKQEIEAQLTNWGPYGAEGENVSMEEKRSRPEKDCDQLNREFLDILNTIATNSLGQMEPRGATQKKKKRSNIEWDQELYEMIVQEREAYLGWKCADKADRVAKETLYRFKWKERRKK